MGSDRLWEREEGRDKDSAWGSALVIDGSIPEMAAQEEEQYGVSPRRQVQGPDERHPSGSRGFQKSKSETLRTAPRGQQMFGARRVLRMRVIYAHFSDEEIEAETSLQVGIQGGAQLPLERETAEPYEVWRKGL